MKSRAINMHKNLSRLYSRFIQIKNHPELYTGTAEFVVEIYLMLVNATVLELTDDEYLSWFIKGSNKVDEEYINFMLYLKNTFIDKRR